MMREDLIPTWNGSLERAGVCPGLSTYTGPSILSGAIRPKHSPAAERPVSSQETRRIAATVVSGPLPTPGEVRAYLKVGFSLNATARRFGCSVSQVRRLRDEKQGQLFDGGAQG